jgi:HEAT repeat protein
MHFNRNAGGRLFSLLLLATFAACAAAQSQPGAPQPDPREQSWAILDGALAQPKAAHRMEAVKALSLISGNSHAIRLATHALQDKDARVRTAAAGTLGQLHATSAIPDLKKALSDSDISVVLGAAYALFTMKDPSAYPIYYAILMGDKKSTAGPIQAQLNRLKDPKQVAEMGVQEGLGFVPFGGMGFEAYRALMSKDSSPVRAAAARFLAHDPDPTTADALLQAALADKSDAVRQAALDAIAERGDATCIERLVKNLSDEKTAVRYRTAATILHLSGNPKRAKPTKPAKKAAPNTFPRP